MPGQPLLLDPVKYLLLPCPDQLPGVGQTIHCHTFQVIKHVQEIMGGSVHLYIIKEHHKVGNVFLLCDSVCCWRSASEHQSWWTGGKGKFGNWVSYKDVMQDSLLTFQTPVARPWSDPSRHPGCPCIAVSHTWARWWVGCHSRPEGPQNPVGPAPCPEA